MVRNSIIAATLAAGGLLAAAPNAPAKADIAIGVGVNAGPVYAGYAPVYHRRWHRPRVVYRSYRPYRYRYRPYRPALGVYVAPAPRAYRRCWINRWGRRVCGY